MKTLDLNWLRIGLAFVVPTLVGLVVARLLWQRNDTMMGNAVGAGAIFVIILLFFAAEYIEIARFQMLWVGVPYRVRLGDFNRYVIYAFAGFVDAAIVFLIGLRFGERRTA
jgi:predicted Na+-dependent transporter